MTDDIRSQARERVIQFLYQCECERVFHFSQSTLDRFLTSFPVQTDVLAMTKALAQGVLKNLNELDSQIQAVSTNWSIKRMSITDRSILRLGAFELGQKEVPPKVTINECIELAKRFGTEKSGKFVNGILDKIKQQIV